VASEKTCFLIAPIGDEGSVDRERSDQVRDFVIKPALEKSKYVVTRADEISKSGIITSQVIQNIFDADLVIAYLATDNPNVFYELALRHVVRKPFIQIIEEGQKIPFDVSGLRTIQLKYGDLRSAENCKIQIQKQVEALEKNPEDVESPVTQAIDVKALRGSSAPVEQGLATVIEMIEELKGEITGMKREAQQSNPFYFTDAAVSQNPSILPPTTRIFWTNAVAAAKEAVQAAQQAGKPSPTNPTQKGRK
jgi:hypothetical protein